LKVEIEIKLRLPDKLGKIRRRLRKTGFRIMEHRSLESNTLFDNAKHTLRKHGKLVRVRATSGRRVLTFKGPSQASKYKKRPEVEIDMPKGASIELILEHMGYHPVFRYEKFRTGYAESSAAGKVLLDETPIGNFLEIEGSPRWIDRTARRLGFSPGDYITRSYGYLYLAYCRERRIPAKDMLFKNRLLKK
jgi:adenylate cyclase class 2